MSDLKPRLDPEKLFLYFIAAIVLAGAFLWASKGIGNSHCDRYKRDKYECERGYRLLLQKIDSAATSAQPKEQAAWTALKKKIEAEAGSFRDEVRTYEPTCDWKHLVAHENNIQAMLAQYFGPEPQLPPTTAPQQTEASIAATLKPKKTLPQTAPPKPKPQPLLVQASEPQFSGTVALTFDPLKTSTDPSDNTCKLLKYRQGEVCEFTCRPAHKPVGATLPKGTMYYSIKQANEVPVLVAGRVGKSEYSGSQPLAAAHKFKIKVSDVYGKNLSGAKLTLEFFAVLEKEGSLPIYFNKQKIKFVSPD